MAKTEKWEDQVELADATAWRDIYVEADKERLRTLALAVLQRKALQAGVREPEKVNPTEFTQDGKRVLRLKATVDRAKPPAVTP